MSRTKKRGPQSNHCFGGPFLRGISPFAPRGNNFFFKNFSHKSLPYKLWTIGAYLIFINVNPLVSGTKKRGPQSNRCFGGPFLRVFSPFAPRVNIFFSKIFLIKVCHPNYEQLELIWFSLMLTLWCLGQKREAPKATVALGAPFWRYFPTLH